MKFLEALRIASLSEARVTSGVLPWLHVENGELRDEQGKAWAIGARCDHPWRVHPLDASWDDLQELDAFEDALIALLITAKQQGFDQARELYQPHREEQDDAE